MIYPTSSDLRAIVSAGGIPGCEVMPEDVKTTKVILGCLVIKMKGNTVRKNAKCMMQSIIMVPKDLIKLQQDVELAINCFFISKHTFFTTYSTKLCLPHNNASYLLDKGIDMGSATCEVQDVLPMWLPNYCY